MQNESTVNNPNIPDGNSAEYLDVKSSRKIGDPVNSDARIMQRDTHPNNLNSDSSCGVIGNSWQNVKDQAPAIAGCLHPLVRRWFENDPPCQLLKQGYVTSVSLSEQEYQQKLDEAAPLLQLLESES